LVATSPKAGVKWANDSMLTGDKNERNNCCLYSFIKKIQILNATLVILLIILIVESIKFLIKETNFEYYSFLFSHLPQKIILIRYFFSIFLRIFLTICCVGTILKKKAFAIALIFYATFTIMTVYWKHPYATFERIYHTMLAYGDASPSMVSSLPLLTMISVIKNYVVDIGSSLLLILLLNNKKISSQFR
jgi:hypothetical protein